MTSEILDEISTNNDKIYLVTKKAGEEGEKNIWGPIMIQGGEDDFKKNIKEVLGTTDTSPGVFHKIFHGMLNNKSAIFKGSLMSVLGIAGYSKYVMDGFTNNKVEKDEKDKTEDTTENFENLEEYQESKIIDRIIFYLSIANIVYALKDIILKIFKNLFNKVFKGGDKAKAETVEGGGISGIAKGQGMASAAKSAAAKIGDEKGKTTSSGVKIQNPVFEQEGGGKSDVAAQILGYILSLIQFVLGIYFLHKSYASLYP